MKKIKICFVDFWKGFTVDDFYVYDILKKKYMIELDEKNPDYIFYSCFGSKHLDYDHAIKIFYTGENMRPDFNVCDYAIGFDYMEYEDRYIRYPIYLMLNKYLKNLNLAASKKRKKIFDRKFCNMVVSNSRGKIRNFFFKELSNYKQVDSGGKIFNNVGGPVLDKILFSSNYKFTIAFENSSNRGYCTEKIVDAFLSNSLPIYYGDPTVVEVFNPKSFIMLKDVKEVDKVIDLIKFLDNNETEYVKYFEENILNEEHYISIEQKKLESFIYNIFDKDYNSAKKCHDDDYSYIRYTHLKELAKIYNSIFCKIIRKIRLIIKEQINHKKYS